MRKRVLIFFLVLILSISLSNAIKTITVEETDLVSLKPQAYDEDDDKLNYSFTEPLDQEGKWQTDYSDTGEYTITITVSDGELSTSQDVLLVVKKKNIGPTIDTFFPEETELTIDEGGSIDFKIKASDRNKDAITYKWNLNDHTFSEKETYNYESDYGDAGTYRINVIVSDGEEEQSKEWTVIINKVDRKALIDNIQDITAYEGDIIKLALPNFKKYKLEHTIAEPIGDDGYWETGYDDAGQYVVGITIRDREFSASKALKLEVINKDRPPIFKPIANAWMDENQKVTIEFEASDPDNDEIEFSAESLPIGASIEGNKFEWTTNYDTVKKETQLDKALDKFHLLYKPFKIVFIAKSEGAEAKQPVLIMVKDSNRAPVLSELSPITLNEGENLTIKPESTDPDGDNIGYSYSGWMNSDTYTTNYDDAGTYVVMVTASDGFLTDEKPITVTVNDINRAPIFEEIENVEIKENEKVEIKLPATDPEGDSISISSTSSLRNSTIEDNIFTWTPDYDTVKNNSEIFAVNFKATDGKAETTQNVNITVNDINRAPKITSIIPNGDFKISKNIKVKFEVNAEDLDGDELTYLWKFGLFEQHKAGSAIARTFISPGTKKVKVIISDGKEKIEHVWNVRVV